MLSNHISWTIEVFQRPQQTQQPRVFSCCVSVVDPSNIGLQLAQSSHGVRRHSCHGHGGGIWNLQYILHIVVVLVIIVWSEQEHATFSKFAKKYFLANLACIGGE